MYQPIMSEENVRRLYFLKQEKRKPMTRLLDQILNEYFEEHNNKKSTEQSGEVEEGGEKACMNAKSAETPLKSNPSRETMITTADTRTVLSAETGTKP